MLAPLALSRLKACCAGLFQKKPLDSLLREKIAFSRPEGGAPPPPAGPKPPPEAIADCPRQGTSASASSLASSAAPPSSSSAAAAAWAARQQLGQPQRAAAGTGSGGGAGGGFGMGALAAALPSAAAPEGTAVPNSSSSSAAGASRGAAMAAKARDQALAELVRAQTRRLCPHPASRLGFSPDFSSPAVLRCFALLARPPWFRPPPANCGVKAISGALTASAPVARCLSFLAPSLVRESLRRGGSALHSRRFWTTSLSGPRWRTGEPRRAGRGRSRS